MPIYEYFCPNCKLKFELLRPLSQSNKTALCPYCHSGAERIFFSFASFSKSSEGVSTRLVEAPLAVHAPPQAVLLVKDSAINN